MHWTPSSSPLKPVTGRANRLPTLRESDQSEEAVIDDSQVLGRINELAREEHELFERESRGKVTDADRARLRRIEVTLDQCWDLLRQRRARRAAGLNPDDARVRDEKTVEGYTA